MRIIIFFLTDPEIINKSKKLFKSNKHKFYTVQTNKIALSCNDYKFFIITENINTLTYV